MPDGFSDGSEGKESACNAGNTGDAGDAGSIPGSGRSPGEGNGNSLQHSCLGNPMGDPMGKSQRGLAGYSPWGRKELDTTERISTHAKPGPAEETWPPQGRNLGKSGTTTWRKSAQRNKQQHDELWDLIGHPWPH